MKSLRQLRRSLWRWICGSAAARASRDQSDELPEGPPHVRLEPEYGASGLWYMGPGRDLGSLEYDQVGLPEALEADIRAWAHSFEQTLDHTYPPLSGWSDRESYDRFIATAHDLYTRLQVVADERGWKLSMSLPEYYQRGVLPVRHDWRRQGQERYLRDLSFTLLEWSSARPGWDHDHCEFCNAKFSNAGGTWRVGYATEDRYRWICPTCYADFWREFGWAPPAT